MTGEIGYSAQRDEIIRQRRSHIPRAVSSHGARSVPTTLLAAYGPVGLLAQADSWREMGRDFRVDHAKLDPTLIIASVVVLVAVIVFLWFLHRLMNRQEGRRLYNSPKQLLQSLCRAHELTNAQRRLLTQLARAQQLPQPASLFLDPDRFDAALQSPAFQSQRQQLERLRAQLFADLNELSPHGQEPLPAAAD